MDSRTHIYNIHLNKEQMDTQMGTWEEEEGFTEQRDEELENVHTAHTHTVFCMYLV